MKTVIIDYEPKHFSSLEQKLITTCPQVNISGYATNEKDALQLIEKVDPSLVFMEVNMPQKSAFQILQNLDRSNFETIFVAHTSNFAVDAIKYEASGYVMKPLKMDELLSAIEIAEKRIQRKQSTSGATLDKINDRSSKLPANIIGIPTLEGFEFLPVEQIIRCEGYQRCTRIITKDKTDILSSYHIGVFKKRLATFRFYAPHKSHLINLHHIKKYLKEGTIKMSDDAFIPVSKRRKSDFIKLIIPSR